MGTVPGPRPSEPVAFQPASKKLSNKAMIILGAFVFLLAWVGCYLLGVEIANSRKPSTMANVSFMASPGLQQAATPSAPVEQVTGYLKKDIFQLTGILTDEDGVKTALINDEVVGVGDYVNEEALVQEIQEKRVILDYEGEELTLKL